MKLQILQIADAGVPNQERLHLRVLEPTNLSYHLVISSAWVTYVAVANGAKSVFWFPPQEVKPNDEIVLYTRTGTQESKVGLTGAVTYFYFWGEKTTIWNATNSCALVFDVANWAATVNQEAAALAQQLTSGQSSRNALSGLVPGSDRQDPGGLLQAFLDAQKGQQSNTLLGEPRLGKSSNSLADALKLYDLSKPPADDDPPKGHF